MILFSPYILNGITYILSGVLAYLELILTPHVCLHPHPSVSGLDHFPQLTSHLCLSPRPLQSPFCTEQAIQSVFCTMSLLHLTLSDHSPLKGNKLHVPHCGKKAHHPLYLSLCPSPATLAHYLKWSPCLLTCCPLAQLCVYCLFLFPRLSAPSHAWACLLMAYPPSLEWWLACGWRSTSIC